MTNKIVVLGSLNMDTILTITQLPKPGETIKLINKNTASGGKGANQAVAAARAGGAITSFIGKIGADPAGQQLKEALIADKIDITNLTVDPQSGSGQAYVLLQENGQNSIVISGGTNDLVATADIDQAKSLIAKADFLIAQFEVPLATIDYAFAYAHSVGVKTILNPAPAKAAMPAELLRNTDLICPNETEAQAITGVTITDEESMRRADQIFNDLGCVRTIITVGEKGAFYADEVAHTSSFVPAFKVVAKDTTAAGDTFIGALAAQLNPDFSNLALAVLFANQSSALAVQKLGAQPSIPTLAEINALLNK
ncbi:ribokinase [Bombilactobacillus thymidiniphilus]|uniref:Ribokinase n=1 Tax=Bombilactobacillus thymidiniphilus TaxID=2923363 RepID=A0ABY4PCS0_9LACO|nr:ribokinase [Bombilactobacillus thymidiniphilus]UQS83332.1 ribokinase [Bombilactobacillus thymidiniphilus]